MIPEDEVVRLANGNPKIREFLDVTREECNKHTAMIELVSVLGMPYPEKEVDAAYEKLQNAAKVYFTETHPEHKAVYEPMRELIDIAFGM